MKKHLTKIFPVLAVLALCAASQLTAAPANTRFTYQGSLFDGEVPANGDYELTFDLFDAAINGTAVSSQVVVSSSVSNGVFTVQLDFGSAFNGGPRWLEIGVKTNGAAAFTSISPRQELTAAPQAVYAVSATSAAFASVAANLNGSVSLAQIPTSVLINNASNVSLSGTFSGTGSGAFEGAFVGEGSGLTNVGGTFNWNVLSATNAQMAGNNGYLVTNDSKTSLSLPLAPKVGEVVRVSGAGLNGWTVYPNGGQAIVGTGLPGAAISNSWVWTGRDVAREWTCIASSADGSKLVAAEQGVYVYTNYPYVSGYTGGKIYTSTDSGLTWTPRDSNRMWKSVASSADGTKVVATVSSGYIYTSSNGGANWTQRDSSRYWGGVASSADGTKLLAAAMSGQLYTSTDSGVTWTPRDVTRSWLSVASSADGVKLVAAVNGGQIYTSTDSGVTWTPRDAARGWRSIACSADGTKLVAGVFISGPGSAAFVYTSVDSGVTWTPRLYETYWTTVSSSADGKLFAAADSNNGQLMLSTDYGVTWSSAGNRFWLGIACAGNGQQLAAAISNSQLQIGTATPSGVARVSGNQNAALELQYVGGGKFLPISYVGSITNSY